MTLETVTALREQDVDVVVTLPVDGPLAAEARARGARVVVRRVPVLRKHALTPSGFLALAATALAAVPRSVRLLREVRPATVYVATVTLPLWLLLARCLRLSTVCHVHEAERAQPRVVRRLLAAPLRLASRIAVNSEVSRAVVVEDCPAVAARVTVVRNGVAAPPTTVPPRPELTEPVRLVFVGRLSARKGADLAVDAIARLAELGVATCLDIVGDVVPGAPEYRDELLGRIDAAGLGGVVTLTGFVPDVWPHLQAADVVLVPSRGEESFGNAAAEGVLAARPVLVAGVAGLRGAVGPYAGARVVLSADPEAWAAAVLDVRSSWPALRLQVLRDAEAAARDLAPQRYRREIADVVHGVGSPRPAPAVENLRLVVAVLTYRRHDELAQLLPLLGAQAAAGRARTDVLVVDNDPDAGAADVVRAAGLPGVRYVHEPEPGIAAARNRALTESADADLLVFIDDDERPDEAWLAQLLATYERTGAAGVVGPVVSEFVGTPHPWVAAGRFFDRRRLPTGTPVDVAATNNLLLDLHQVRAAGVTFDARYGLSGGSDSLFTLRLTRAGLRLVWCDEAVVVDRVPAERSTPGWVLARAFRMGNGWSRVSLELTTSPVASTATRAGLVGAGAVRLAGGVARWATGALLRRTDLRARGARTLARGAGLVTGAAGFVYAEYRRPAGRPA
jgi:succinoglycan biosynthesis protein ExoM